MPAWLNRLTQRFPRSVLIWAAVTAVLGLGVLTSISHLAGVSAHETMRANSEQQRVIIDPKTGAVSGLGEVEEPAAAFDVAQKDPAAQEPVVIEPTDEPVAEEPTQEPAAEDPVTEQPTTSNSYEPLMLSRADPKTPLVASSNESLVTAPAPEVSEKVEKELLPKRGEKDASPATLYAKAFTRQQDQHLVAIVVTDIGFNGELLNQALELPTAISMGVSPYADAAADQIGALRNKGHEVWTMLPLMGKRYPQDDPGPLGLINALTIKGAMARLHTIMADTMGSVGFIMPPDETFSTAKDLWKPVWEEIDARGLYLLSTHATRAPKDLTADAKQQEHIRRADVILDSTPSAAFIRSKLAGIAEMAAKQPELIVLVSARPHALKLLADWLKTDPFNNAATLAPLSAIYVPYKEPAKAPEGEEGHGAEVPTEGGH